jgi:NTP-dependent ternary system trypsin peptidase co-occuring protein
VTDAAPLKILVELPEGGGLQEEGFRERTKEITQAQIEKAADQARQVAEVMTSRLKAIGEAVSEISVEFGVSFEGSAGVPVFAQGKVGATLAVTVTFDLSGGKS